MVLKGSKAQIGRAINYMRDKYGSYQAGSAIQQMATPKGMRELVNVMFGRSLTCRYIKQNRKLYIII
jgi:hypothetical protein